MLILRNKNRNRKYMNRIVLIGNGLDLAHGLNTKYADFIDHLCKNICIELRDKWHESTFQDKYGFVSLTTNLKDMDKISIHDYLYDVNKWDKNENVSDEHLIDCIYYNKNRKSNILTGDRYRYQCQMKYSMPNHFLNLILKRDNRWADIEQLYYDELLKIKDDEDKVNKLNQDFEVVKKALQNYLTYISQPSKNEAIENIIYSPIYFRDVKQEKQQVYRKDIESIWTKLPPDIKEWLKTHKHWYTENNTQFNEIVIKNIEHLTNNDKDIDGFLLPDSVYMLSFNYTNSEKLYEKSIDNKYKKAWIDIQVNHIHGKLNDPNNSIIFGYGDEYDSNYEQLEKSRVNGVLDNIKSMKYLETTNYRNFESYINSAPYQVIILGHSCALSDNTLLKTLFEHDNCVSIKPYYYEKEEGDNYNEIIQALSRCFTDKSKLRSVVVNKEWCNPLPQNKKNL